MSRVAFVRCVNLPEPDPDEPLLLEAVRVRGIHAESRPWDDPDEDWSAFDLAIVRSTWNYYQHPVAFQNWIQRASSQTRLLNPPALMLRNMHKSYLVEMEEAGVPVVPTSYAYSSEPKPLESLLDGTGWTEFVIKPAISASSFMTRRFSTAEMAEASEYLALMLMQRDAMVQQFLPLVADSGEVALIHIEGELTHGVFKRPRFTGDAESVSSAIVPTGEQREVARAVLDTVKEPWLYARIDLMRVGQKSWALSEFEAIEPSLYFVQSPAALERFASAVSRLLDA